MATKNFSPILLAVLAAVLVVAFLGFSSGTSGFAVSTTSTTCTYKTTFYKDVDGDTYGNKLSALQACSLPVGYSRYGTDCNDADKTIKPGTVEICGDSIDNNCNGKVDETKTFYRDADADSYGSASDTKIACAPPTGIVGYVLTSGDCNDADAKIKPYAAEVCDNLDNDCDKLVDEGIKKTFYKDADSDAYGDKLSSLQACTQPSGYVAPTSVNNDCNDSDANIKPGTLEVCGNNVDDNCNGKVDENMQTYYLDSDNDGVGTSASTTQSCESTPPAGHSVISTDCNDGDTSIRPGATEICGDGLDQDCNGSDLACAASDGGY